MVEQLKFEFGDSNEIIFRYAGRRGAKGEKRLPRRKKTPEQMERANQNNRRNYVRRLIKLNFSSRDLWVTLKYPAGTKKTVPELKKDFTNFIARLRRRYKKAGIELKFVYRMEVGSKGGLHVHLLVNHIPDIDIHMEECWKEGHIWYTHIYEEGGYERLADYITKKPDKQIKGQLSLFPEEEQEELIRYGRSRNLKKPEPKKKVYSNWTMNAFMEGEDPKPSKGFYVDKDSIHRGINPYTGLSYIYYTEYRIGRRDEAEGKQAKKNHKKHRKKTGQKTREQGSLPC